MRLTAVHRHTVVAVVTLAAMTVTYRRVECPECGRLLASAPSTKIEVRPLRGGYRVASGRGPVVWCRHCDLLCEVIEHGDR